MAALSLATGSSVIYDRDFQLRFPTVSAGGEWDVSPAATLRLVSSLTNCCTAALTNLPAWEYVPVCRAFSTSTLTAFVLPWILRKDERCVCNLFEHWGPFESLCVCVCASTGERKKDPAFSRVHLHDECICVYQKWKTDFMQSAVLTLRQRGLTSAALPSGRPSCKVPL